MYCMSTNKCCTNESYNGTSIGIAIATMESVTLGLRRYFLRTLCSYLVTVDVYSKWLDVQLMNSITSENSIANSKNYLPHMGYHRR